jgi:hypothetical protein
VTYHGQATIEQDGEHYSVACSYLVDRSGSLLSWRGSFVTDAPGALECRTGELQLPNGLRGEILVNRISLTFRDGREVADGDFVGNGAAPE